MGADFEDATDVPADGDANGDADGDADGVGSPSLDDLFGDGKKHYT
jgi:hypothetical protein